MNLYVAGWWWGVQEDRWGWLCGGSPRVSRTFAHLLIQQMIPEARNNGNTFSFIYLFGTRFLNASCLLGPENIIVNRNQTLSLPSWSSQSSVNLVINDNKRITNI